MPGDKQEGEMTDRIHSLTVVLERDIREDDIEPLILSIKMLRHVLDVKEHVADAVSHMAEERARHELGEKILAVIYPKKSEGD